MPDNMPSLQRRTSLLKGWFVPLDEEKRNLLKSDRFRLLLLFVALLLLLLLNLCVSAIPDHPIALQLSGYTV